MICASSWPLSLTGYRVQYFLLFQWCLKLKYLSCQFLYLSSKFLKDKSFIPVGYPGFMFLKIFQAYDSQPPSKLVDWFLDG